MSSLRRWSIIAVAVIMTIIVWGAMLPAFALWAPQWISAFGASHGEIMAANTINQVCAGLLAPFAGLAVSRIAVRYLMLIGLGAAASAFALIAFATAMWQVTLIHALLLSISFDLCGFLMTQVLAVRLFKENRGLAIGVVTASAPACAFTMPPLIGFLLTHYGWRTVELQMAVLVLALAPLVYFVVRETPVADGNEEETLPVPTVSAGSLLQDRYFWGVLLSVTPLFVLFNAIYYNLGFSLADLGGGPGQTATLMTVTGFFTLPAVLGYGALADRIPTQLMMALTVLVLGITCTIAALFGTYAVMLYDLPVMGITFGGLLPLVAALLAKRYGPENFALVSGIMAPFLTFATLGAAVAGVARDYFGSYPVGFTAMLALLPICAIGLYWIRPLRQPLLQPA